MNLQILLTQHFNPRPPWGGRHIERIIQAITSIISIHALRGEGDSILSLFFSKKRNFNPRPPWGGRPGGAFFEVESTFISIHALRGEGDEEVKTPSKSEE